MKYIERLIVNFVRTLSDVQLLMNKLPMACYVQLAMIADGLIKVNLVDLSMRCENWEIRRTGFSSGWFGGVPSSNSGHPW